MADPGSAVTIILIAVFAAALAMGTLLVLGTKRQAIKSGAENETRFRPPSLSYVDALISFYKWAFSYNVRPAETDSATVVRVEQGIRAATAPVLDTLRQQALLAPAVTSSPDVLSPAVAQQLLPPVTAPTSALPSEPLVTASSQAGPPRAVPSRTYGLLAIIDIIGDFVVSALTGMAEGTIFIFEGVIKIFDWMFRIDRKH